jgi:anti-sigma B factor antagonist
MLTIDVEKNSEVAVVHCNGRLVRGVEVSTLRNAVVAQKATRIVVLDLSQVEFMDAGGLNALVSLHHWTCNRGVQLKLVNPSRLVREMLTRTRLNRVFDISSLHDVLTILSDVGCHHAKYGAGYLSQPQTLVAK